MGRIRSTTKRKKIGASFTKPFSSAVWHNKLDRLYKNNTFVKLFLTRWSGATGYSSNVRVGSVAAVSQNRTR